jgi:hypothetical protein
MSSATSGVSFFRSRISLRSCGLRAVCRPCIGRAFARPLAPRNDMRPPSRRANAPELCTNHPPAKQRARGTPGVRCTRSLACKTKKHTSVITTGLPVSTGVPRANGFNGLFRALPGDRAFLPPSPAGQDPQGLTPASGRQDHTALPSASGALVSRAACVHRIPRQRP